MKGFQKVSVCLTWVIDTNRKGDQADRYAGCLRAVNHEGYTKYQSDQGALTLHTFQECA